MSKKVLDIYCNKISNQKVYDGSMYAINEDILNLVINHKVNATNQPKIRDVMDDFIRVEINTIIRIVELECNKNIKIKTRDRKICKFRQYAHFFACKYTDLSLVEIGQVIGSKSHATVINSYKSIDNLITTDKKEHELYEKLNEALISKRFLNKNQRKQLLISELEARIRGVELTCNCGVIEHYFISMWKSRIEKIKML